MENLDKVKISKVMVHKWEEPCISGDKGSFAIFLTGCNLSCVFCQNYEISTTNIGEEKTVEELANIMLNSGDAHNINLVSPSLYILAIAKAIRLAKGMGLNKPIVYNTNSYESINKLRLLDGLVDVYLPDLKYFSNELSTKYSKAPKYFDVATKAILEMYRQVPVTEFDENGIIKKGIIIRHLCLPGCKEDSKKVLDWVADNLPKEVYASLMSQYLPTYKAHEFAEINRKISKREYESIIEYFFNVGLENGFTQELESASKEYVPDFKNNSLLCTELNL